MVLAPTVAADWRYRLKGCPVEGSRTTFPALSFTVEIWRGWGRSTRAAVVALFCQFAIGAPVVASRRIIGRWNEGVTSRYVVGLFAAPTEIEPSNARNMLLPSGYV